MLLALELLTADELQQAQRLLAEAPWGGGTKTAGSQARSVKRNRQIVAGGAAERALQALVLGALERSPAFLSAALPRRVLPPRFNRYGGELNTLWRARGPGRPLPRGPGPAHRCLGHALLERRL